MAKRIHRVFQNLAFAILVPGLAGALLVWLAVKGVDSYGLALFYLIPLIVSILSAFFFSYGRTVKYREAYGVALLGELATGAFVMVFALDGLVCLLMAYPLAAVIGLGGAAIGRAMGSSLTGRVKNVAPILLVGSFPFLLGAEAAVKYEAPVREVETRVMVKAPIEDVWGLVIAFPKIEEEPTGVFRFGIAYPIEAAIEGEGVGAVRYCRFSTGDFVEPITKWEAPTHLAFDVVENPCPMEEFSIYGDIEAPHLHGHMVSEKGEFRLRETEEGVELVGRTWYRHSLRPQFYWGAISDQLIHQIHERVLNHIKAEAEK